jgi:hypothetical protein
MSASKKLATTLAAAGGGGLNVEEVFSTYLYTGNSSTQTITNGIDLDGEGGMVWIKARTSDGGTAYANVFYDTERGVQKAISSGGGSYGTSAELDYSGGASGVDLYSFNSDGFSLGTDYTYYKNSDPYTYASWTFRKAPKFFDVVTYTGDGVTGREIAHNLGTTVGTLIVKDLTSAGDWHVWHRSDPNNRFILNGTSAPAGLAQGIFGNGSTPIYPTSTEFTISGYSQVNTNGNSYIAYLFAHNDGDGDFGESGDQDIIKCGSYTGNGSSDGPEIDLGFEPQWLLIKNASSSANWELVDNMRDFRSPKINVGLFALNPNLSDAEAEGRAYGATSTGFKIVDNHADVNASGSTYIYIAIRRPMKTPESGTEVFAIDTGDSSGAPEYNSGFPVDMSITGYKTGGTAWYPSLGSRLIQGKYLQTANTSAEDSSGQFDYDFQDGWYDGSQTSSFVSWMWKRAPGFFDVVCYTGDGVAGRTVDHNLGVAPEMMWVKIRSGNAEWHVYHHEMYLPAGPSLLPEELTMYLNTTGSASAAPNSWNDTAPTDTQFTLGTSGVNNSGHNFIAYLFASLDGISKVGSYTGNGTSQTIDCGFSTGARFVLIKRTDSSGDWHIWDTERGIVAGNDLTLYLNQTYSENNGHDTVDPDSSGFIVNQSNFNDNASGGTYIFYAIA